MKIDELRQTIKDYSPWQLALLVTELYRAMPRQVKERKDIDQLIRDPESAVGKPRAARQRSETVTGDVVKETNQFIEDAYNQYYFAPNRVISKHQRLKWRFIVKRLYNDLGDLAAQTERRQQAAELIEKLYVLLSNASRVALFNTPDPFQSIGIRRADFFRQVLAIKATYMGKGQLVREAVTSLIRDGRGAHNTDLIMVILEFLPIPDLKYLAIKVAEELKPTVYKEAPAKDDWRRRFYIEQTLNSLTELIFHCYAQLGEYEQAINYFQEHYQAIDPEVKLYILARFFFEHGRRPALIAGQIAAAQARGIEPRESLLKLKNYIETHQRLPEYMP